MVIIGIVGLLVIGPERLPSVARQVGRYVGKIKRFVANVRSDVEREFRTDELQRMLQQQQNELNSLRDAVNETRQEADLQTIENSIRDTANEVKADPDQHNDGTGEASAQANKNSDKESS